MNLTWIRNVPIVNKVGINVIRPSSELKLFIISVALSKAVLKISSNGTTNHRN